MAERFDLTRKDFLKLAAGAAGAVAFGAPTFGAHHEHIKRAVPKTGEEIPVVGLGTAVAWNLSRDGTSLRALSEIINALLEGGGTVIDTSPTYSRSEQLLGLAYEALGVRDRTFLATKISTSGERSGIRQSARTFEDLQTDMIDLLQVHNLRDTEAHLRNIRRLRDEGRVRLVGITHYLSRANDRLEGFIESEPLDFVQCQYSVFDRGIENRILPAAREKGVAVMINVPFARGRGFRAVRGHDVPEWAKEELGIESWGQYFLKFVLGHEAVTVVIPGTTKARHMRENIRAGFGPLPDARQRERMVQYIINL